VPLPVERHEPNLLALPPVSHARDFKTLSRKVEEKRGGGKAPSSILFLYLT
jgi:hypothetical protein